MLLAPPDRWCPTLRAFCEGCEAETVSWRWSSYRAYAYAERGPVLVNESKQAELKIREVARAESVVPTLRKRSAKGGATA
jgi:hypothetical protein